MTALNGVIYFGLFIQLFGLLCFVGFYFKKRAPRHLPKPAPGLSIIKPCFRAEDGEEEIFASYFQQEFEGPLELIFAVSDEKDAIVPLINEYIARHPHVDAKLVISKTRKAYWRKIDAYYDAYQIAKHDHVIISDSDTIVDKRYAAEMVAALSEPGVSVVTVPQYDIGANNFATALKTVGNNCDVAVYVMVMNLLVRKKTVGWGHSIGFRKSEFDEFGEHAWEELRNRFGDDLVLPTLFSSRGKRVVYRNIYCPVNYTNKTLAQMLDQQKRFALCQKAALGPWIATFGLLLFPQVVATIGLFVSRFSVASIELFFAVWAVRVLVSFVFEALMLKSVRMTLRYFWTIPFWDLLKIYFVAHALSEDVVRYHGRDYRVRPDALLVEIQDR